MRIGRTFLTTTAALSVATWCMTAPAQTALLASPPDSAELREARVAIAHGPAQSTLWFSAKIEGAADDIHVIVPVPPGARIDLSTDAWFEALADTTHTRVIPPQAPPDVTCEQARVPAPGDHDLVGDVEHVATVPPAAPADVMTMSEVVVWVQDQGMSLSFDALSQLANLDIQGFLFVRLRFEVDPGTFTLRTIRVASPSANAKVPLVLTSAGASPALVRVWAFAEGRANPSVLSWSTLNPADVHWSLAGGVPPTNYRDALGKMLDVTSWAVDASSHDTIYRSLPLGGGSSFLPAVIDGYFDRASGYGDALATPATCIARVAAMEASMAKVGRVCAPGALVDVSGPACEEEAKPGEIAAADLRCGGIADDLALAMAGTSPGSLWLTRWTGKLSPWTERHEDSLAVHDGAPRSAVVVSGGWDSSVCDADAGTAGSTGSGGSGGGGTTPPNTGGYGGGSTWSPPQDPYEDPYGEDYGSDTTQVYVEGSCWGDSSTSNRPYEEEQDDSCSGDSSSSSSSSDESCSGDSSGTDDGETCAGDSSDSGDSDACSGDSSDSGGEEACSGDSSSSSGSDACSGDSASSSGDACSGSSSSSSDCSVTRRGSRGRGRLPTSAFALLLVASALAARRLRKAEEARNPLIR
jgi:hypothetical protein